MYTIIGISNRRFNKLTIKFTFIPKGIQLLLFYSSLLFCFSLSMTRLESMKWDTVYRERESSIGTQTTITLNCVEIHSTLCVCLVFWENEN